MKKVITEETDANADTDYDTNGLLYVSFDFLIDF